MRLVLTVTLLALASSMGSQFVVAQESVASNGPIPSTFFGMHIPRGRMQDWPTVPIGALGKKSGTAWRWLEPSPGAFHWQGLDSYVEAAESHGVPAMYTFGEPPQWASSKPGERCGESRRGAPECPAAPKIDDWNAYVTAVVRRYKGRIRFYELWNEPNNPHHWSGSYKDMVELGKETYKIVKSIDPNAIVLTPGTGAGKVRGPHPRPAATSLDQTTWLDEYLRAGGNEYADAVSFHAYPRYDSCSETLDCAGASLVAQVDRVRAIMERNGAADKPLYVTEGGWRMEEDLPDPNQQVAFVGRWFLILASKGVTSAYWYAWDGLWGTLWDPETGLHPAGRAYEQVYKWLIGATISPCYASRDKVWTCSLTRGGGYSALAIWTNSGGQSYTPEKQYRQYKDLTGNTVAIRGPIQIGPAPILLETSSPR